MANTQGVVEHDSWSELCSNLLYQVTKQLDYDDYVRLRAVCKEWNLNLPKFPKHTKNNNPWLAFVNLDGNPLYSIGEEKAYFFKLPKAAVIIGSCDGWLAIAGVDGEIQMLNPFTKAQIGLPHMSTLPGVIAYDEEKYIILKRKILNGQYYLRPMSKSRMQRSYIAKVVMMSPKPDQDQGDFMAIIICRTARRLAYCKLGDKKWTSLGTQAKPLYIDAVYHQGKIYAVSIHVELCVIHIESGDLIIKVAPPLDILNIFHFYEENFPYVVSTPDGVIMVIRHVKALPDYKYGKTYGFDLYKITDQGEWSSVNNLGDYVLMLGYNTVSVCILPCAFSDGKGNRIYYTDNKKRCRHFQRVTGYDVGYYDLEDGTIHQLFPTSLLGFLSTDPVPPAPVWLLYRPA